MGIISSTGKNNDELVDNLIESNYIRYKSVEWVMRLVDRGDFFPNSEREIAYKDMAWKESDPVSGPIHLSAPCIYANALEFLDLQPGMSFLNFGSGTGYLNTLAGFLLTETGINHGVELYDNLVQYAVKHLSETMKKASTSAFSFCVPEFFVGSAFFVKNNLQYDRIYCGALVPPFRRSYFGRMLKINGIMVMPYETDLVRIVRTDENSFSIYTVSQVSFSNLHPPSEDRDFTSAKVELPLNEPKSLQEICRLSLRAAIRKNLHVKKPLKLHFECGPIPQPDQQRRREPGGMGAVLVLEPRDPEDDEAEEEPEENPSEAEHDRPENHEDQEGMMEAEAPEENVQREEEQPQNNDEDSDDDLNAGIDADVRELNNRVQRQVNETLEMFRDIRRRHNHIRNALARNRRGIVLVQEDARGTNRANRVPRHFEDENGWQGNHIGDVRIVFADLDENILNINIGGGDNEPTPQTRTQSSNTNHLGYAMHDEELRSEFSPLIVPPTLEHVQMSEILPSYCLEVLNRPSTSEAPIKRKRMTREAGDHTMRAMRANRMMNEFRFYAPERPQGRHQLPIQNLMQRVRNRVRRRQNGEIPREGAARTRPVRSDEDDEPERPQAPLDQPTSSARPGEQSGSADSVADSNRKRSAPETFDDPNETQVKRSNSDDNISRPTTSDAAPEPQSAMSSPGVGVYEGNSESRESSEAETAKDSESEKTEKEEKARNDRAERAKAQNESLAKFHKIFMTSINNLPISERLIRFLRYEN